MRPPFYKPNSVSFVEAKEIAIYLGPQLLTGSSDSLQLLRQSTILHARKDFAVSPELNRFVTVRTSILAEDGGYPLRLIPACAGTACSDFPLQLAPE